MHLDWELEVVDAKQSFKRVLILNHFLAISFVVVQKAIHNWKQLFQDDVFFLV